MLQNLIKSAILAFTIFVVNWFRPTSFSSRSSSEECSVQVVVLGDLGRSPRMQYHALSIVNAGGTVQLIGYLESDLLPELQVHPNAFVTPLPLVPATLQTNNKLLFLIFGPLKILLQVWNLWLVLGYRTKPTRWMLVQNPPAIPTLFIAAVVCYLRRARLVIDWHNFGYTILALKLGPRHPLVRISHIYEKTLARTAYSHFAVTDVMRDRLRSDFVSGQRVLTLHDRPAPIFQPLTSEGRTAFVNTHPLLREDAFSLHDGKTKLIVSSTSWTPDEDFSVLLRALCIYSDTAVQDNLRLPHLHVIITGKGPQKDIYLRKIEQLRDQGKLVKVNIQTAWLSFDDYASLLGCADLGVSLHTSSSGVDLPMKVVDMFGAGLPVLGFDNFKAWPELVTENVNGKGFSNAEQMARILEELFEPENMQLRQLKAGAVHESKRRWSSEWNPIAGRLFGLFP